VGTNHISGMAAVLSRASSQVLSTLLDGQCGKLVTVVGHQFITLTVCICIQHRVARVCQRQQRLVTYWCLWQCVTLQSRH